MTSLSLNKLELLLSSKGLVPKRYFRLGDYCVFIELISIKNADTFVLTIPSKYKFIISESKNVFKLKPIEIDDSDTEYISNEYAKEPDDLDLEKEYEEIDLTHTDSKESSESKNIDDKEMPDKLIENYKRPISLKDLSKEDAMDIKDVIRQIKRLKYCVQNIRYTLVIIFKSYLCFLKSEDRIDMYMIKHSIIEPRKLLVACDLELLYEKIEIINMDIQRVKTGIHKVLDKNQFTHTRNLQTMLERKNTIPVYSNNILSQKEKLTQYISSFEVLLEKILGSEKEVITRLYNLEQKYKRDQSIKGLYGDIEKSHQKQKIENELNHIERVKDDIIKNIISLKDKREYLSLTVDKILFDNIVMLNSVFNNFETLEKLS